jgi:hypothetical protein
MRSRTMSRFGFFGVVVFENAIGFVRPHDLSGTRFPPEAARMTEGLGFGQIRVASPDSLFRNFTFRNVDDCADYFIVAGFVRYPMCNIMKILYRAIRHQQPMLIVKVASVVGRPLECVFDEPTSSG